MNIFSEYQDLTVDLIFDLLEDAYEDEDEIDRALMILADEVFEEVRQILEEMDLTQKIRLEEHPAIYRALKEIENNEWRRFTDWCWMGYQVITGSLLDTYKKTLTTTYDMFRPKIASAPTANSLEVRSKTRDTYITERYLKVPWCQDGKTYSDRLWHNVSHFQEKLQYVLEYGVSRNKGIDWMIDEWRRITQTAGYEVARLLKTETMAMWSQATKEAYLDMGIEYVEIINPEGCEEVCSEYVGEVIPLREAELGNELPPYHPNCVCDFVAYEEG